MSIRETICNQLIELGFEAVESQGLNSNKAPMLFLDDSDNSSNGSSTWILFYSMSLWVFNFVHKQSAFHYWDIKARNWVKIEDQTLDIATMIMLYK